MGGRIITNLRFADDTDGLAGEEEGLTKLAERLDKASTAYGIEISAKKTKLMTKKKKKPPVASCLLFIRSGKNHLARHNERGKKTRQTEEEVRRQHRRMDRPRVRQVQEGSGEHKKVKETGCEIICGAPTTLAVKG